MDFLSNFSKINDDDKPVSEDTNKPDHHRKQPSKSDVLHSAKVVADAAQSHFRHEPEKYDKAEVAGATADILNAAAEYGKLEDNKRIGKYVDKAEDYLRHYHTSHSAGNARRGNTKPTDGHQQHSGGGSGDFMKMAAGDFLKK